MAGVSAPRVDLNSDLDVRVEPEPSRDDRDQVAEVGRRHDGGCAAAEMDVPNRGRAGEPVRDELHLALKGGKIVGDGLLPSRDRRVAAAIPAHGAAERHMQSNALRIASHRRMSVEPVTSTDRQAVRKPKDRSQAVMNVIETWCRAYVPQVTVEERLRLYRELIALWAELSIEQAAQNTIRLTGEHPGPASINGLPINRARRP